MTVNSYTWDSELVGALIILAAAAVALAAQQARIVRHRRVDAATRRHPSHIPGSTR